MLRWSERLYRWSERLYGGLILALGGLFLYWSGRGLLAYYAGIRAAWSEPLACGAGILAGLLSIWVGMRLIGGKVVAGRLLGAPAMPKALEVTLEAALKLEQTDPAGAQQLIENYYTREAAATEERRASLRQRARHDRDAALELRRELQDELSSNAFARDEVLKSMPEHLRPSILDQIDADVRKLQAEVRQLDGIIVRATLP